MKRIFAILSLSVLLFLSCDEPAGKKQSQRHAAQEEAIIKAPPFHADSAYNFVKSQVDFGPRVPNTPAAAACAAYLTATLQRFCDTVYVQDFKTYAFDKTILNGKNIIGVFNPEQSRRVLLAAHWDSRPFADHDPDPANHRKPISGANDGASGVGVLLEAARQLSLSRPNIGVDIMLLDAEDYGAPDDTQTQSNDDWGLGSQYWSKTPHIPGYKAEYGILLDMVGDGSARFPMEFFSGHYARHVLRKTWDAAAKLGYGSYFLNTEGGAITDDHYYINTIARIPMIDIIHLEEPSATSHNFVPYWHTLGDDLSNIAPTTLKIVGEVVLYVVYNEKK